MKGLFSAIFLLLAVGYSNGKEICKLHYRTYEYCEDGYYCCHFSRCCKIPTTTQYTVNHTGSVAGIVIGSIVGVSIVAIVLWLIVKRCNKNKRTVHTGLIIVVSGAQVADPVGQQFRMTALPGHSRREQPLYVPQPGTCGISGVQLKGSSMGSAIDGMPPQYSRHWSTDT